MNNQMDNKKKTVKTEEMNKPYTLRPLKDKDLWPVLDIVGKVFPDDLSSVFLGLASRAKTVEDVGYAVLAKLGTAVIRNMNTVHDEMYAFLSDVSGIPAEEIEEMEFGTTPSMIRDIVKNAKNSSFFGELSKLS